MRLFPILFGYNIDDEIRALRQAGVASIVIGLPWAMLEPHERQAQRNHSQTLKRLAERGGLGASEAVAVLLDREFQRMDPAPAHRTLGGLVSVWQVRHAIEARHAPAAPAPTTAAES